MNPVGSPTWCVLECCVHCNPPWLRVIQHQTRGAFTERAPLESTCFQVSKFGTLAPWDCAQGALHIRVDRQKNWMQEIPAISAYVTEISTNNFARGLYGLSSYCLQFKIRSENDIFVQKCRFQTLNCTRGNSQTVRRGLARSYFCLFR